MKKFFLLSVLIVSFLSFSSQTFACDKETCKHHKTTTVSDQHDHADDVTSEYTKEIKKWIKEMTAKAKGKSANDGMAVMSVEQDATYLGERFGLILWRCNYCGGTFTTKGPQSPY